MQYCVIDTERIKGNIIYLFSYQIYNEANKLIESKTFFDKTIDISNRKSPKQKVKKLWNNLIITNGFFEIYKYFIKVATNKLLIVFSTTDIKALQKNCRELNLESHKFITIDMQKILFDLSDMKKHKCNLKDYCINNNINHNPHIPESDCFATFELYKNLVQKFGQDFINKYVKTL